MATSEVSLSDIAQIATARAVVIALVVGPWITIKQVKKSTVLASRQNWINALRADVAAYITAIRQLPGRDYMEVHDTHRELELLKNRIQMSINPVEQDHIRMIELLKEAKRNTVVENINDGPFGDSDWVILDNTIEKIVATAG